MDKLLEIGKKFLPTPAVLLFAHVVYATICALVFVLNMIFFDDGWSNYCGSNYWTIWILWIFAVVIALLIALVKYKESSDVLVSVVSFLLFWATLFGLQTAPFYCYSDSKAGNIIRTILRAIIDVLLTLIYFLWSRDEIMKYVQGSG